MPVSTNDLLNTKNVRVENPDGSKAVFMYFDPSSDAPVGYTEDQRGVPGGQGSYRPSCPQLRCGAGHE